MTQSRVIKCKQFIAANNSSENPTRISARLEFQKASHVFSLDHVFITDEAVADNKLLIDSAVFVASLQGN